MQICAWKVWWLTLGGDQLQGCFLDMRRLEHRSWQAATSPSRWRLQRTVREMKEWTSNEMRESHQKECKIPCSKKCSVKRMNKPSAHLPTASTQIKNEGLRNKLAQCRHRSFKDNVRVTQTVVNWHESRRVSEFKDKSRARVHIQVAWKTANDMNLK